jgi:hypothetical protein
MRAKTTFAVLSGLAVALSVAPPAKRRLRTASTTWRRRIESHEAFSHDSIESLAYDWERIGNPKIPPKYPFKVYLPRSTEDVAAAVREVKQLGQELKIRSKGHSSNDLVLAEGGAVMLMQAMDQIVSIDEEGLTATVQAGAINALLDDELAERGLGLPVIGDHKDITVGGFVSVGGISPASHRFGMFIDNVEELEYVNWDGEIRRCSRTENSDEFYSLLAGLGRHGVITEAVLRLIPIDKYRTIWFNDQTHYRSMDAFIAGTKPIIEDPGDTMMERGVWVSFGKVGIGQFSAYKETSQGPLHKARNTASYGVLHGIGLVAGHLPEKLDKVLKYVGITGVLLSPKYASIKNIEFFTDKLLDSTVGDPTRMLIVLGPLDRYEHLFRDLWALLESYRDEHGCFTFISVYVKSIRSEYLARDGQDRFCELMFYVGVDPDKMTPELLDEIVDKFDGIVIENNAYKYMHTRTVKDPERRAKVDPNLRHAERRRSLGDGKGPAKAVAEPALEESQS